MSSFSHQLAPSGKPEYLNATPSHSESIRLNHSRSRPAGPHLSALRAFEAAARHQNFVSAANELHVTPGAVSQHIKTLEAWAGTALFTRHAHGVTLTDAGRTLLPDFVNAFDGLDKAVRALRTLQPVTEIHIATFPSIAQLWLPSRLNAVRDQVADVRVSVTTLPAPPNLRRELFDIAIFVREPTGSETEVVLADDLIYPVCAPSLARRLRSPEDLNTVPLLYDQLWEGDWKLWSKRTGVQLPPDAGGPRYSLYSLAVEEAKAGAGVLIGHDCLIGEVVNSGELVPMFGLAVSTGRALAIETTPEGHRHEAIRATLSILQNAT